MLNIIHSDLDEVWESKDSASIHNIVDFTKQYGMKDRFVSLLKHWFRTMNFAGSSNRRSLRNCGNLWIANELGIDDQFQDLKSWVIFNLVPDGNGDLWDPSVVSPGIGEPLKLSSLALSDRVVTHRIIRLRIEAVNFILTRLKEVQLAMTPTTEFSKDGRIHIKFEGHACSKCLDLWFGCFGRSLLQPRTLNFTRWRDFLSISSLTDAKEYLRGLEELCSFIDAVQEKIDLSRACSTKGSETCIPPKMLVRLAVQKLINESLVTSPGDA
ncbi:hypothetical protein Daus18300_001747 [Diaporthe australafricana]|uniref:Uncharacterized protein n=1 Tax=Diaporthe australafricana TaxID=127596 RepID=A0ABR3XT86_9PEZI